MPPQNSSTDSEDDGDDEPTRRYAFYVVGGTGTRASEDPYSTVGDTSISSVLDIPGRSGWILHSIGEGGTASPVQPERPETEEGDKTDLVGPDAHREGDTVNLGHLQRVTETNRQSIARLERRLEKRIGEVESEIHELDHSHSERSFIDFVSQHYEVFGYALALSMALTSLYTLDGIYAVFAVAATLLTALH